MLTPKRLEGRARNSRDWVMLRSLQSINNMLIMFINTHLMIRIHTMRGAMDIWTAGIKTSQFYSSTVIIVLKRAFVPSDFEQFATSRFGLIRNVKLWCTSSCNTHRYWPVIAWIHCSIINDTDIVPRPWMMTVHSMLRLQLYAEPFSALWVLFALGWPRVR